MDQNWYFYLVNRGYFRLSESQLVVDAQLSFCYQDVTRESGYCGYYVTAATTLLDKMSCVRADSMLRDCGYCVVTFNA